MLEELNNLIFKNLYLVNRINWMIIILFLILFNTVGLVGLSLEFNKQDSSYMTVRKLSWIISLI